MFPFFLPTSISSMQWHAVRIFQLCNVTVTPTWEKSHKEQNIILTVFSFPLKTLALLEASVNHFIASTMSAINTGLREGLVF